MPFCLCAPFSFSLQRQGHGTRGQDYAEAVNNREARDSTLSSLSDEGRNYQRREEKGAPEVGVHSALVVNLHLVRPHESGHGSGPVEALRGHNGHGQARHGTHLRRDIPGSGTLARKRRDVSWRYLRPSVSPSRAFAISHGRFDSSAVFWRSRLVRSTPTPYPNTFFRASRVGMLTPPSLRATTYAGMRGEIDAVRRAHGKG